MSYAIVNLKVHFNTIILTFHTIENIGPGRFGGVKGYFEFSQYFFIGYARLGNGNDCPARFELLSGA